MKKEIFRFSKNTITYGIGHTLTRFIPFLLLPIYTNFLIPDEYGAALYLQSYFSFLMVIYLFGFDVSLIRFYVLAENQEDKQKIFSSGFISILTIGSILSIVLIFCSPFLADVLNDQNSSYFDSGIIIICVFTLFFDSINGFSLLVLRAEEKAYKFLLIRIIGSLLNFTLNIIYIVILKSGIIGIFISNLIASGLSFFMVLPIIKSNFKFKFSKIIFSDLTRFGVPYIFSGLAILVMDLIDRIILKQYKGLDDVGIYGAAYKLAMIMAIIVGGFRFAWHPFFLSVSKQDNAKNVFSKILTLYTFVTFFVLVLVSTIVPTIVRIKIPGGFIFGAKYWAGIKIIPVIMLSYLCYGVYVNFIIGIYLSKKSIYIPFVVGISAVVNILLNFLLIPLYGIWGAAVTTLISYILMMTIMYFINNKLYPVKYEYLKLGSIFISAVSAFTVYYMNIFDNNPVNSLLSISIFICLSFLFRVINLEELSKLKNEIIGKLKRN